MAAEGEVVSGKAGHLLLYDAQGRPVKAEELNAGPPQHFDWGDLPPGMYFYQIRMEGERPQGGKLVVVQR